MSNVIAYGIDISEHNGVINWDEVKKSGKVDFVMLRAGYGKGVVDKKFHFNANECERVGIPIGIYWFSYAKNADEAEEEALYCLDVIKQYKSNIYYPVAYDFEDDSLANCKKAGVSIIGKDLPTSFALNFLNRIKSYGYCSAIYTNPAYMNQYFDMSRLSTHELWLAQWPYNPDPRNRPISNPQIWQYSSSGNVPGIKGNVDLNVSYEKYILDKEAPKVSVMTQEWAKEAVEKAVAYGFSDGTRAEDPALRVEVMAMVNRAVEKLREEFDLKSPKLFNDGK